jgi:cell division septation protein DedD
VVVVAIAILAWLGVLPGFGSEEAPAGAVSTVLPSAPAETVDAPTEASPLLAYSLALAAHRDPTVARGRVDALSRIVPGVLFSLAPAEVDGEVFYRVLAGPAVDSAGARSLAGRVAQATGMDPAAWVVRATPRAFQLGEVEDLATARERTQSLEALDVPAYVLAVDYSDGSTRFRVYAGAYADETEASFLSGVLAGHSLSFAPLSHRIGRLPE